MTHAATSKPPRTFEGNALEDMPEVPIFAPGRYASEFDDNGQAVAWVEYSEPDMHELARNINACLATGQPIPIKHGHKGRGAIGWLGRAAVKGGKLVTAFKGVTSHFAEMFRCNRLLGRSVEITAHPASFNFRGISGLTVKALAFLTDEQPRVKTLDSKVFAEVFSEPASGGHVSITFQEAAMPEEKVAAVVAESAQSTAAAVEEAQADGMAALAANLEAMQAALETVLARVEAIEAGISTEAQDIDDDEKKEGDNADDDDEKKEGDEQMSEARLYRQRAAAAEAEAKAIGSQLSAILAERRDAELQGFAETCRDRYGKARADELVQVAGSKLAAIDISDSFDETGAPRSVSVFDELLTVAGPRTIHRTPGVARKPASVGRGGEHTEESVTADIFSEVGSEMVSYLKSRPDTLSHMVKQRLEAQE